MHDLVRRLRNPGGSGEATVLCRQAADTLVSLVAALEGLVKAVDEAVYVYADSAEMQAARAALREVGRGE